MRQDQLFMTKCKTSVVSFLFLIKKSSCFLQMVVCVLLPRGCSYLQLEKGYVQLEKIKTKKKDYVQFKKVKTKKNITNESLRVPCVIDQCSRGDRTCG